MRQTRLQTLPTGPAQALQERELRNWHALRNSLGTQPILSINESAEPRAPCCEMGPGRDDGIMQPQGAGHCSQATECFSSPVVSVFDLPQVFPLGESFPTATPDRNVVFVVGQSAPVAAGSPPGADSLCLVLDCQGQNHLGCWFERPPS